MDPMLKYQDHRDLIDQSIEEEVSSTTLLAKLFWAWWLSMDQIPVNIPIFNSLPPKKPDEVKRLVKRCVFAP